MEVMESDERDNPHIIGLTGSFGSGCTYIGEKILHDKRNYQFFSLSGDILKPLFQAEVGKDPDKAERHDL